MSKAVMISIQPKWCELIASGKKTIEVRKTAPKIDTPFKCYIYETKAKYKKGIGVFAYGVELKGTAQGQGKVIGEFVCDKIDQHNYHKGLTKFGGSLGLPIGTFDSYMIFEDDYNAMCLTYEEVKAYGKGKTLYGLHISDLVIYDTLKDLREFKGAKICPDWENDDSFDNTENCYNCEHYIGCNGYLPLTTPPQSWRYIAE